MKPKTVITHWIHQEVADFLSPHCELVLNETRESLSKEEILTRSEDATAIMVFMPDSINESFIRRCPQLKIVAAALKGYDNFDVEGCTRYGIWFTIVPDLLTVPTAELTIALMLGVSRHLLTGDRTVRSGSFPGWRPKLYGTGISGCTVAIIGMGFLGQAVAKRLSGFGCNVIYNDIVPLDGQKEKELNTTYFALDDLISQSDFILTTLPLTEKTNHLINTARIQKMKPGSYLINTGRGSVVDELAVSKALESGHLAGYAADVFEMEDWARKDRPKTIPGKLLTSTNNTLFTPHLGSAVDEIRKEIAMEAARNIVQVLQGKAPKDAINHPNASF